MDFVEGNWRGLDGLHTHSIRNDLPQIYQATPQHGQLASGSGKSFAPKSPSEGIYKSW